jgi:hypothetical protein
MKNVVFCDVKSRGSSKTRRFGGTYPLHLQGDKNRHVYFSEIVATNIIHRSPIIDTLPMGALRSSETSVLTRSTQRNFLEKHCSYLEMISGNVYRSLSYTGSSVLNVTFTQIESMFHCRLQQ